MTCNLEKRGDSLSKLEFVQGDYAAVEDGQNRYNHSLDGDDTVLQRIKKLAEAAAKDRN
jgi:hypothetical protein